MSQEIIRNKTNSNPHQNEVGAEWSKETHKELAKSLEKTRTKKNLEAAKDDIFIKVIRGDTLGTLIKGLTGKLDYNMPVDYRSDRLGNKLKPQKLIEAELIYPDQFVWVEHGTVVVSDVSKKEQDSQVKSVVKKIVDPKIVALKQKKETAFQKIEKQKNKILSKYKDGITLENFKNVLDDIAGLKKLDSKFDSTDLERQQEAFKVIKDDVDIAVTAYLITFKKYEERSVTSDNFDDIKTNLESAVREYQKSGNFISPEKQTEFGDYRSKIEAKLTSFKVEQKEATNMKISNLLEVQSIEKKLKDLELENVKISPLLEKQNVTIEELKNGNLEFISKALPIKILIEEKRNIQAKLLKSGSGVSEEQRLSINNFSKTLNNFDKKITDFGVNSTLQVAEKIKALEIEALEKKSSLDKSEYKVLFNLHASDIPRDKDDEDKIGGVKLKDDSYGLSTQGEDIRVVIGGYEERNDRRIYPIREAKLLKIIIKNDEKLGDYESYAFVSNAEAVPLIIEEIQLQKFLLKEIENKIEKWTDQNSLLEINGTELQLVSKNDKKQKKQNIIPSTPENPFYKTWEKIKNCSRDNVFLEKINEKLEKKNEKRYTEIIYK